MVGPTNLDAKARSFIAMALRHEIARHEQELRHPDLTEDEASDLTNDMYYMRELLGSIQPERGRPGSDAPPPGPT